MCAGDARIPLVVVAGGTGSRNFQCLSPFRLTISQDYEFRGIIALQTQLKGDASKVMRRFMFVFVFVSFAPHLFSDYCAKRDIVVADLCRTFANCAVPGIPAKILKSIRRERG